MTLIFKFIVFLLRVIIIGSTVGILAMFISPILWLTGVRKPWEKFNGYEQADNRQQDKTYRP